MKLSEKAGINRTLKRSTVLGILIGVLFVVLIFRILIIQTVKYETYQSKVISQITTETPVRAKRGTIYDRNGNVLATNITAYNLIISPSGISNAQKDRKDTTMTQAQMIAKGLAAIIGENYEEKVIREAENYPTKLYRKITERITDDDIKNKILAFISDNKLDEQVYLEATSMRYYPYGTLGCHIIGFCNADGKGNCGIEYYYNDVLAGKDGRVVTARDAYSNEMKYDYESYVAAVDGSDVWTTIDIDVQRALDEQCEQSLINTGARDRTCGIVMEPETGGILAMSTAPAFDLNKPNELVDYYKDKLITYALDNNIKNANGEIDITSPLYTAKYNELRAMMQQNKALTYAFIPGSTFKIITSALSLDNKVITDPYAVNGGFNCVADGSGKGVSTEAAGVAMHCHSVHGSQDFAHGLMNSCNVTFIHLGLQLGVDRFYSGFDKFGYLNKTGIDLQGEGVSVPFRKDKMGIVELATSAFGQNFKITGIQHITAVNAVVNGGTLLKPFVVSKIADKNGVVSYNCEKTVVRQVASAKTCETLRTILEECVSGGYGGKNCYVAGYRVAAKTGTSEKVGDDKDLRIGSVMAFAPAEKPVATAFMMCDEPDPEFGSTYGSTVAAPYMQALLTEILPYLNVSAKYTDKELEELVTSVPNLIGYSVSTVEKYVTDWFGVKYKIIGDGTVVHSQFPEAGASVKKEGMVIYLYTSKSDADASTMTIPKLTGKTADAANAILTNMGFNVAFYGANFSNAVEGEPVTVTSQYPAAGNSVPRGTVVKLYFGGGDDVDVFFWGEHGEAAG